MARRAVRALAADLEQRGVQVSARVKAPDDAAVRGRPLAPTVTEVAGDAFVFACGAWLPSVFPPLLRRSHPSDASGRAYFGTPAGDDRFGRRTRRRGSIFRRASTAFPRSTAAASRSASTSTAADRSRHATIGLPDPPSRRARARMAGAALSGAADAPVVETRVCQYENTSNGDFLIDRHPAHDNVWIVGGGSGHGFKHGPAVGELAARMVLDGEQPDPRFALAGKTTDARRSCLI